MSVESVTAEPKFCRMVRNIPDEAMPYVWKAFDYRMKQGLILIVGNTVCCRTEMPQTRRQRYTDLVAGIVVAVRLMKLEQLEADAQMNTQENTQPQQKQENTANAA